MTKQEAAIARLARILPRLREEGWILTPSNTSVSQAGVVDLKLRQGEMDLGNALVQRFHDLAPNLEVEPIFVSDARHVIFRL